LIALLARGLVDEDVARRSRSATAPRKRDTASAVKETARAGKTSIGAVHTFQQPEPDGAVELIWLVPNRKWSIPVNHLPKLAALTVGATLMTQIAAAAPNAATDPRIDPQVRSFLGEINKDSSPFWELPQPRPQEILTGLQSQTAVDLSGVTTTERTVVQDGRTVKLYIMKPEQVSAKPGVLLFIHGGVWIVGNFQNHQRLLRDLVVGSGQVGVFVEYSPLPGAKFPTQLEECYAALKWVAEHAGEFGADGGRVAVAGNSVGGNMTAALALMSKDRNGPKISYQVLLIPATDASVDTESYHEYGTGRFLARTFMKYGWDLYAPDAKTRDNPYVSPLRAGTDELKGLPPALVITAENDPLRDEGEAYARKLKEAGVNVDAVRYNGTIHDFVLLNALRHVPSTEAAIDQINDGLRQHLEPVTN
jgi:acetyl esterase